jgi:putative DNA methylase
VFEPLGSVALWRLPEITERGFDVRREHWLESDKDRRRLLVGHGAGGKSATAELVAKLGSKSEVALKLAYRLHTLCKRKKRAAEALACNGIVQSWPELARLVREGRRSRAGTGQAAAGGRVAEW